LKKTGERGLNKNVKKYNTKKESYLDKCPEWDTIESTNAIFIPILKNGNLCQPVKIKGETIQVRNTCAFDAIIIIVVYMIGTNAEYKNIVESIDDSFLQLAIKIACQGKITKYEYIERASFLINLPLFKQTSYTRRFNSLDAMCNAAHIAEYIFLPLPSVEKNKICKSCHYTNEKIFAIISVNVNILLNKGL